MSVSAVPSVIRRKLTTLLTNPGAVLRKLRYRGIVRPIRRLDDSWGRFNLRRHGICTMVARRADEAFPPHWGDLWFLYREIRMRKSRVVLEFGSGWSTLVIARAIADNHRDHGIPGVIYSVDCSDHWATTARHALPETLAPYCHIVHSPLITEERFGRRVFRHAALPDISPDFVYLDGPEFPAGVLREERIVADLLDIEARLSPSLFVVVDGREPTFRFLREHLSARYACEERPVLRRHSLERTV